MKKVIILTTLILMFNTQAKTGTMEDKENLCTNLAHLAQTIMIKRQQGVSMDKMLKIANGLKEPVKGLAKETIIAAYEKPKFRNSKNQLDYAMEFQNEVHLTCLKQIRKK